MSVATTCVPIIVALALPVIVSITPALTINTISASEYSIGPGADEFYSMDYCIRRRGRHVDIVADGAETAARYAVAKERDPLL